MTLLANARMTGDLDCFSNEDGVIEQPEIERILLKSGHPGLAMYLLQIFLDRHTSKRSAVSEQPVHLKAEKLVDLIYRNLYSMGIDAGFYWSERLQLDQPKRVRELVYAVVEEGFLATQPSDQPEDFGRALPAVFWFENRRRWEWCQRSRRWPGVADTPKAAEVAEARRGTGRLHGADDGSGLAGN